MKKFKFFSAALVISLIWVLVGVVHLHGDKTPDAGLGIFNYVLAGVVICGVALLIDLYLVFRGSVKNAKSPSVQKRARFWQITGGLVAVGIVYLVYVLAVT
jgi:hypothetical protein